ncbi:MAG: dTDP-4-dehydrorhamnose reductase [Ferruginibacter sp.]|nr:dTDP-4-dehydrorhamnose reductase [Ferruginibacter sp.]
MSLVKAILITGANGQLGQCFQVLAKYYPQYHFLFTDKNALQIADENAVNVLFEKNKIDVCINCAAYTAVDKAETERELAIAINATAVGYLARACKKHSTQFIHISTDYVFDGTAIVPYKPTDITKPVNFYGQTKLDGELNAAKENAKSIIIRTAWVYSEFGNNFLKTMMRLMNERENIGVVNDQKGAPTYAADLADAIMQIIEKNNFVSGIYHYSNKGNISWYNFAKEIASQLKTLCIVNPITTSQFPTPAARPKFSVLDSQKIEKTFEIQIPEWKSSLTKCILKMV